MISRLQNMYSDNAGKHRFTDVLLVFTFLFVRIIWKGITYFSISPKVSHKKVSGTAGSFFTWLGMCYVFSHAKNSNHHQKDTEFFQHFDC